MDDNEPAMPATGTEHSVKETIDAGHKEENSNDASFPPAPAHIAQLSKKRTPRQNVWHYLRMLVVPMVHHVERGDDEKSDAIMKLMLRITEMGLSPNNHLFVDYGAINRFVDLNMKLTKEHAEKLIHQLKEAHPSMANLEVSVVQTMHEALRRAKKDSPDFRIAHEEVPTLLSLEHEPFKDKMMKGEVTSSKECLTWAEEVTRIVRATRATLPDICVKPFQLQTTKRSDQDTFTREEVYDLLDSLLAAFEHERAIQREVLHQAMQQRDMSHTQGYDELMDRLSDACDKDTAEKLWGDIAHLHLVHTLQVNEENNESRALEILREMVPLYKPKA